MLRFVPCAGGIVLDDARRLLLIRRGTAPAKGTWSLPGGRCCPDEAPADACVREVFEETGLRVRALHAAGRVHRDAPDGSVYEIDDFVCALLGGVLRAGDDATDARWVTGAELADLSLAPLLFETLREWDCLPR